jgi:sulfur relay (sulfurtransferase) DsrF/TusC family protein
MKPRVLFVVTGDPRTSPRPAEAVRIAAGVGAWEKVEATLYLRDAAVLALGENAEELVEGESYVRYLPLLAESGRNLYAQSGAAALKDLGAAPLKFATIDDTQLADLVAASTNVLRF